VATAVVTTDGKEADGADAGEAGDAKEVPGAEEVAATEEVEAACTDVAAMKVEPDAEEAAGAEVAAEEGEPASAAVEAAPRSRVVAAMGGVGRRGKGRKTRGGAAGGCRRGRPPEGGRSGWVSRRPQQDPATPASPSSTALLHEKLTNRNRCLTLYPYV
jgi:hypothetical protein